MEEIILCDYRCGRPAIKRFKNEKYCCSELVIFCPEVIKNRAENRIGRTKENDESVRRMAKKNSIRMKNGGASYAASFVTEEGRKRGVEKLTGRSKETYEYLKRSSEKVSKWLKTGGSVYIRSFITDESRNRQAEKMTGTNHPRWNPNREQVFAPYTEEFYINAPKVRERDKYICRFPGCFKHGKTVHHIDENKEDSRMENMINLCSKCHRKIHAKDKGIWVIFYQPYFRCIVNENQNRILPKEQVKEDIENRLVGGNCD